MESFHQRTDLENLDNAQIAAFLDDIAVRLRVSSSTQRQALNALVFYYREVRQRDDLQLGDYQRARKSRHIPTVLSPEEVQRLLPEIRPPYQLMAKLQYGAGLRVAELISLRIKDIDLSRGQIHIHAGKGNKDRVTLLPKSLQEPIARQIESSRELFDYDRRQETPGVYLPPALSRKYPKAGETFPWHWLWPANDLSTDPRSQVVRRHHMHPGSYQRGFHQGVKKAGMTKRVTTHVLRHSFATHLLENGTNIAEVQSLLGHKNIETTQIYLHVRTQRSEMLTSPLDHFG
ncbi:class 1 integron integrase IntI1 [Cerasicoccus arenae]|uniref:Class 1 integron integrase IntI1 n=1 Tax=Cerasicoccus arenae TaxID=424488 RepID=A0A8J3DC35_9BACT|nr:integron integrase [Cerasicoccus arenae]GHC03759.1 class 1 integron integrase IntI1 [Cerasicoccus arenae]